MHTQLQTLHLSDLLKDNPFNMDDDAGFVGFNEMDTRASSQAHRDENQENSTLAMMNQGAQFGLQNEDKCQSAGDDNGGLEDNCSMFLMDQGDFEEPGDASLYLSEASWQHSYRRLRSGCPDMENQDTFIQEEGMQDISVMNTGPLSFVRWAI